VKCADQRFGLGYKLKKKDYRWAAGRKGEKRMARIRERELEEEDLAIPPLKVSF
jgi:hypothetical protein